MTINDTITWFVCQRNLSSFIEKPAHKTTTQIDDHQPLKSQSLVLCTKVELWWSFRSPVFRWARRPSFRYPNYSHHHRASFLSCLWQPDVGKLRPNSAATPSIAWPVPTTAQSQFQQESPHPLRYCTDMPIITLHDNSKAPKCKFLRVSVLPEAAAKICSQTQNMRFEKRGIRTLEGKYIQCPDFRWDQLPF